MDTTFNPQIELAFEYVTQTDKNIFLTGKAGTGKTTFLHRIVRETNKRTAVVAPTGVAAINAEGVTIHSLFQLPFGPLIPGQVRERMAQRRFSKKKIKLLKSLDLLIIDEISMVRSDVLDGIDEVLRRYRNDDRPFGGLQLLMIGDLHQLPPVVKPQEWDLLRMHYQTPYFFGSLALQKTDAVTIQLKHIYRQQDDQFIDLLNKVRSNQLDDTILEALNSRHRSDFKPEDDAGYITLTSHNAAAQQINRDRLQALAGDRTEVTAAIDGDFPEHAYPNDKVLNFKVDAQVMFVKNDLSPDKRYYNGKIGRITKIKGEEIFVQCPGEDHHIAVLPVEWHNRKYSLDENTKEVNEEIIGTFTQYPLRLAWAITIHKSQGLTFEKVIIDAQAAFAHGQVYVALSRCKTFEGIVLHTPLIPSSVKTDRVVQAYTEEAHRNEPDKEQLLEAKKVYQQNVLRRFFRFQSLKHILQRLNRSALEHEHALQGNLVRDFKELQDSTREKLIHVAQKFLPQLENYFAQPALPEAHEQLKVRLQKAGEYFDQFLKTELAPAAEKLELITDNQAAQKKVEEQLTELNKEISVIKACTQVLKEGYDSRKFNRARVDTELDFTQRSAKRQTRVEVPNSIEHPALYKKLVQWRTETAEQEGVQRYMVAPTRTLLEIISVLPSSGKSLKRINGIGKGRADKYGADILEIVGQYCTEQQLETDRLQFASGKAPKTPKPPKPDTKMVSLKLYKSGKAIEEIARERDLATTTIEGHLAHFIGLGELDIFEILDKEKIEQGTAYFRQSKGEALSEAKNQLGDHFSYGELRMVLKYWHHLQGEKMN